MLSSLEVGAYLIAVILTDGLHCRQDEQLEFLCKCGLLTGTALDLVSGMLHLGLAMNDLGFFLKAILSSRLLIRRIKPCVTARAIPARYHLFISCEATCLIRSDL